MTIETLGSGALSRSKLQREISVGVMVGLLGIPICVAAGVLTASPLGSETAAEGATAGIYGGIIEGIIAAALGSS